MLARNAGSCVKSLCSCTNKSPG